MSYWYVLSATALEDLANIWEFHARNGTAIADKQIRVILRHVEDLTVFPELGRSRNSGFFVYRVGRWWCCVLGFGITRHFRCMVWRMS